MVTTRNLENLSKLAAKEAELRYLKWQNELDVAVSLERQSLSKANMPLISPRQSPLVSEVNFKINPFAPKPKVSPPNSPRQMSDQRSSPRHQEISFLPIEVKYKKKKRPIKQREHD